MVRGARVVFLLILAFLVLIPAVHAVGIAPAKYQLNFTANETIELTYWAVNKENETQNWTIGKGGDLVDYITLPEDTEIEISAGSKDNPTMVSFKVNLTYPGYLAPGKYESEVSVTHCTDGGMGGCTTAASQLWVYSYEKITGCQQINYPGDYTLDDDITSINDTCIEIISDDVNLDCNGYSIAGNNVADSKGIFAEDRQDISITNCEISDWYYGVYLNNTDSGTLSDNDIHDNKYGYYLESSDNLEFDNDELDNDEVDIYLSNSADNIFSDVLIYDAEVSFSYDGDFLVKGVTSSPTEPNGYKSIANVNVTEQGSNGWMLLNLSYDEADLDGESEDNITLARHNDSWETDSSVFSSDVTTDTTNNYVSANITGFDGIFSLLRPYTPPSPPSVGIAPSRYELNFTANEIVELNYWAVNNGGTGANFTIDKGGDLSDYITVNETELHVPASSMVPFKANISFPANLSSGKYESEVSVTYCTDGGMGGCTTAASQLWVYVNDSQEDGDGGALSSGGGGSRSTSTNETETKEEVIVQLSQKPIETKEPLEEIQETEFEQTQKPTSIFSVFAQVISYTQLSMTKESTDVIAVIPTDLASATVLIEDVSEDSRVKAIIFEARSSNENTKELEDVMKAINKPIVVLVQQESSSEEFALLSLADKIIATPASVIHSVDVLSNRDYWTGVEAEEIGMIDYLGDLYDAKEIAEELAGISDSKLINFGKGERFFNLLGYLFYTRFGLPH